MPGCNSFHQSHIRLLSKPQPEALSSLVYKHVKSWNCCSSFPRCLPEQFGCFWLVNNVEHNIIPVPELYGGLIRAHAYRGCVDEYIRCKRTCPGKRHEIAGKMPCKGLCPGNRPVGNCDHCTFLYQTIGYGPCCPAGAKHNCMLSLNLCALLQCHNCSGSIGVIAGENAFIVHNCVHCPDLPGSNMKLVHGVDD